VLLFSVVAVVIATTTYVPPLGSYFCPIVLGTAYSAVKRTGEAAKRLRSDANSGELIG
jgi:hypothetical protein